MQQPTTAAVAVRSDAASDEPAGAAGAGSDDAGQPAWHRWRWPALLAAGWLLQVLWRVWLGRPVWAPVARADEDGYLLVARFLAGGPGADMPGWSVTRPGGYSLLLAPIYWLVQEPSTVYRGAQVVNGLVGALTFPLAYQVGRRLFGMDRVWAAAASFAVAALPAVAFFSEFALSEVPLPPAVLGWLLLVHYWLVTTNPRRQLLAGAAASVTVAYVYAVHHRGLVMIGVHLLLVATVAVLRWVPRRAAVVAAGAVVLASAAAWLFNAWVAAELFPAGSAPVGNQLTQSLTTTFGLIRTINHGVGQVWYQMISTWGLAAVGFAGLALMLRRREASREVRLVLAAAALTVVGIALAMSAGITDEGRSSNHVYGRYIACFAPIWVMLGLDALRRATDRRRLVTLVGGALALIGGSTFLVLSYAGRRMLSERFVAFDSPEISFLTGSWTSLRVVRSTATAVLLLVVIAALVAWRRATALAAVAGVLVINVVAMDLITDRVSRPMMISEYYGVPLIVRDLGVKPGEVVASGVLEDMWPISLRHQREVYWAKVRPWDPRREGPPADADVVIAPWRTGLPSDWNGASQGWQMIASHSEGAEHTWALWRRA